MASQEPLVNSVKEGLLGSEPFSRFGERNARNRWYSGFISFLFNRVARRNYHASRFNVSLCGFLCCGFHGFQYSGISRPVPPSFEPH